MATALAFVVVAYVGLTLDQGGALRPAAVCPEGDCLVVEPLAQRSNSAPLATCPYCGQDASEWRKQTSTSPPSITGSAAAVVEGACGALIYGLKQDGRLPPASLTKIVTAMVVSERANLEDRVLVTVNGWDLVTADGSSVMGLEAGMNLSVEDLLYGLLLSSGNDAAVALADYLGGTKQLVELMNQRVSQIGLANTAFVNPDGRDVQGQYSTALDMALLGREFMANPALRRIAAAPSYRPKWRGGTLWNGNYLLQAFPGAFGVKIGYTEEAGYTIVAAAKRDGRELVVTVLGSSDIYTDSSRLLDWAFANTKPVCTNDS